MLGESMSNLDDFVSNVERKQQCSEVKKNKKPKIILGIVILIVLIIGFKPGGVFRSSQNKVSTVSKSSLEKVLETSQLTTLQYTTMQLLK